MSLEKKEERMKYNKEKNKGAEENTEKEWTLTRKKGKRKQKNRTGGRDGMNGVCE